MLEVFELGEVQVHFLFEFCRFFWFAPFLLLFEAQWPDQILAGSNLFEESFHAAGKKMRHRTESKRFNGSFELGFYLGCCSHSGNVKRFFRRHISLKTVKQTAQTQLFK